MKTTTVYTSPNQTTPASVDDIINVTRSLADLLTEETAFLDKMQIDKVGELQGRKLKLTGLLERYMRYVHQNPDMLKPITPALKQAMQKASHDMQMIMKRNYDKLLVARAVNGTVVKCVTQLAAKKDSNPIYNARGFTTAAYQTPISVTLNQTI